MIFGNKVSELNTLELLIVTTTLVDGWINHERACQLTTLHSREVTLVLPRLESRGFLVAHGEQKQKSYTLPGVTLPSPDEVFALASFPNALTSTSSLTHKKESLTHKKESLTHKECRDDVGRFISNDLDKPYIESLELLSNEFKDDLMARSQLARDSKRLSSELFRNIIIDICKDQYVYWCFG
ncbi:hypothetical protein [Aliivibrio wodanis]|uniref:hypothetical protein n=1 Tax=Aliivibrio wodanis TaxID=80852 RepID=UPI00406CB82A